MKPLDFSRIVFGGTVFGWTVSSRKSHQLLNDFLSRGGVSIDTSDFYSEWAPGNMGGESETIIGNWMANHDLRTRVQVITKVGLLSRRRGLSRQNVIDAANDSLKRLQTNYIDVYMPHQTPELEEIEGFVSAIRYLFEVGSIKSVDFSHCEFKVLKNLMEELSRNGIPISCVEDNFNLLERNLSKTVIPLTQSSNLNFIAARVLAGGYLTGKYRGIRENYYVRILLGQLSHTLSAGTKALKREYRASLSSASASGYIENEVFNLFEVIGSISSRHNISPASVAVSWTLAQVGVDKVCISFRTRDQVKQLDLVELSPHETDQLNQLEK
jgi:aryl-alcohol dehydrogenase-like predicted oxidoreductase